MCLKPKNLSSLYIPGIVLNNEPLSFVSSNKYLGMIVEDKLDDEEDNMRRVKCLYATGNMLIS